MAADLSVDQPVDQPVDRPVDQPVDVRRGGGVRAEPARWDMGAALTRGAALLWPTAAVIVMTLGNHAAGLTLLMLTAPFLAFLWGGRRAARRRARALRREQRRQLRDRRAASIGAPPPLPTTPSRTARSPQRRVAAAVVRAETSGGRVSEESLALVREIEQVLRPLLASGREQRLDARVRHDLDAIAGEYLPEALEAYLVLPAEYAREHRTKVGTTPADELHAQLSVLLEGCHQLADAILAADLGRQQQLGRYLTDKFARSSLDLS